MLSGMMKLQSYELIYKDIQYKALNVILLLTFQKYKELRYIIILF